MDEAWTHIGSMQPSAGGFQTLTLPYTLLDTRTQVVRVNFRYGGVQSSCTGGNYDDVDDLVFSVDTGGVAPSISDPNTGEVPGEGTEAAAASIINLIPADKVSSATSQKYPCRSLGKKQCKAEEPSCRWENNSKSCYPNKES